ncbi:hypothetical protein GALMADRAFT_221057 [Galerina marginata CBS 339.88]|uniref:HNH nuclease domain-containing protein n=1 Tax=Galerina marginata (strain CBS 339.88) TaxID=685588 RepID=A0A067TL63_GALM3|nr:hypothetical protein GALMADRAFT_221057 [Galerina marginata CBS 339.88]
MTSLPANVPERLQSNPHAVSAYNICLEREVSLQLAVDNGDNIGKDLIYIRILGYLIIYVPTPTALHTIVVEVVSARENRAIFDLGQMYYDHYLRAFRANKSQAPTPSNHSSRRSESFDTVADMVGDTLTSAPQSHATAKKHALFRDGYRCVITGSYDQPSVLTIQELRKKFEVEPGFRKMERTQCAHIFAESTNADIEPGSDKRLYPATMWALMERLGYTRLPEELNGPNIHRLENVMTAALEFHSDFDLLMVWLVATDVENKYKIEAADPLVQRQYPEFVTFTTPDSLRFPVPSPTYLAIHAACAKVAHLSGAVACIDELDRDLDDSTTLDPNGASGELLDHAIAKLQIAQLNTQSLLE